MKLLSILLLLSATTHATSIGFVQGTHLMSEGLNDSHFFIDHKNVLLYQNSFNKVGIFLNKEYTLKSKSLTFTLKYGLTSGYDRLMSYKGQEYKSPLTYYGITPVVMPIISFTKGNVTGMLNVMGDSVGLGIAYKFGR